MPYAHLASSFLEKKMLGNLKGNYNFVSLFNLVSTFYFLADKEQTRPETSLAVSWGTPSKAQTGRLLCLQQSSCPPCSPGCDILLHLWQPLSHTRCMAPPGGTVYKHTILSQSWLQTGRSGGSLEAAAE